MGTRGAVGVRLGGHDKITYNHWDSYPEGLGHDTIKAVHDLLKDRPAFEEKVRNLKAVEVVNGDKVEPTPEQIEQLRKYADTGVSNQSLKDWYCLLRQTHGKIDVILDAGYFEDSADFLHDSLFCEYAYVINLDDNVLEVYKGFQHGAHDKGRYAKLPVGRGDYHPVALVGAVPLDVIARSKDEGIAAMGALFAEDKDEEEAA